MNTCVRKNVGRKNSKKGSEPVVVNAILNFLLEFDDNAYKIKMSELSPYSSSRFIKFIP
jgi:hypothetical protein